MNIINTPYEFALDILSHLVLTKPRAVQLLLQQHGVRFSGTPSKERLIDLVIEFIGQGNTAFISDLDTVIQLHLQHNGRSVYALTGRQYNPYTDVDENYDNAWITAAITGAVTLGSTLIKANQKRKARKEARRQAEAEAKELDRLEKKNIARRRAEARRLAKEEAKAKMIAMQQKQAAAAQQAQEEARKKRNRTIMVSLALCVLIGGSIYVYKKRKKGASETLTLKTT